MRLLDRRELGRRSREALEDHVDTESDRADRQIRSPARQAARSSRCDGSAAGGVSGAGSHRQLAGKAGRK